MSREIPLPRLGAGSAFVSASSPLLDRAPSMMGCSGSGLRSWLASSPQTRSSRPSLGFHFTVATAPFGPETGKRVGGRVANHGPIGDSWPIALFGYPRGHRVFIETRCRRRTGPSWPMDALPRTSASQEPDGSASHVIPRRERTLAPDAQAARGFRYWASKCTPFFQTVKVMAAILRAKVRRANSGLIPLASNLS